MPTLPVTIALVRRVRPLPATAALSCVCAFGTREPSHTTVRTPWEHAWPATPSFTPEARDPQRATGHVATSEPFLNREIGSGAAKHGSTRDLLSWEVGSGAVGHMAASGPSTAGRRGPET
jgi:hypothetical protein